MRKINVLFSLILLALPVHAQVSDEVNDPALTSAVSYAPLLLFTNGPGQIVPFQDGEMLVVGQTYHMTAIPKRGYAFAGWRRMNVFNIIEYVEDEFGTMSAVTNIVVSPTLALDPTRVLEFTMQAPDVLFDDPGVRTIIESEGWQANFVPVNRFGEINREP